MKLMEAKHKAEQMFFRKEASDFALQFYKQQAQELAKMFSVEASKLLKQYTIVRKSLIEQNELVRVAGKYSIYQEKLVLDLRQFTA